MHELKQVKSMEEVLKNPGLDVMKEGWKTACFFAPGVGLVYQNQCDLEGNLLNEMGLISYTFLENETAQQTTPETQDKKTTNEPKIIGCNRSSALTEVVN